MPLAVTLSCALLTVLVAAVSGLPLRDPDGFLGPSYVRLPVIVAAMIGLDVIPRVLRQRPGLRGVPRCVAEVLRSRWTRPRLAVAAAGLAVGAPAAGLAVGAGSVWLAARATDPVPQ